MSKAERKNTALSQDSYADYDAAIWEDRPTGVSVAQCTKCFAVRGQERAGNPVNECERRHQQRVVVATNYSYACLACGEHYEMRVAPADLRNWIASQPWSPPPLFVEPAASCLLSGIYVSRCACGVKKVLSKGEKGPRCPECQDEVYWELVGAPS
jgi:hypothetical protein